MSSHELHTERLRLVALDAEEMRLLVEDWPALQRRLGAKPSPAWMTDPQTVAAARRHRDGMLQEPSASMWWTFWQVVVAGEDESVGLVDFKGPPDPDGGVAIGCSFAPEHWNRGYATEAVGPLLAWALGHSSVRFITADTDVANVRAHRVLRKLGFVPGQSVAGRPSHHGDAGDLLAWHLVKRGGPRSGG